MADFDDKDTKASACDFTFKLPPFTLGFKLPALPAVPPIPKIPLSLALSCDPASPVDVVGDKPYGGGRTSNRPPDADSRDE